MSDRFGRMPAEVFGGEVAEAALLELRKTRIKNAISGILKAKYGAAVILDRDVNAAYRVAIWGGETNPWSGVVDTVTSRMQKAFGDVSGVS